MNVVVTTAYRPSTDTRAKAEWAAGVLDCRAVERNKRTIQEMQEAERAGIVVAAKKKLEFYAHGSPDPYFFHPGSAAFRTKRPLENDPLIHISRLAPGDSFLDCTLGMAADAITASARVGGTGKVVGCESRPVIGLIVADGLRTYDTIPRLDAAMRRIEVVVEEACSYLERLDDDSFDVVYMDPMFTEAIEGSSGFAPFRTAADSGGLTEQWVREAKRVARKTVVLKAHFRTPDFERFGFVRRVRPNTKFHFGVIDLTAHEVADK